MRLLPGWNAAKTTCSVTMPSASWVKYTDFDERRLSVVVSGQRSKILSPSELRRTPELRPWLEILSLVYRS
jgi:hypothetical protein